MAHSETFIDGIWYPSVTTIIGAEPKPWLQAWRDKWGVLATRKTEIAGAVGDEFHRCVEAYLTTGSFTVGSGSAAEFPASCAPRVNGMMRSFITWAETVDGTVQATELKVFNKAHTYSGTLDAVGILDGKPVIFDWKTSSRIYPHFQLQLSAYTEAYNEGLVEKRYEWFYPQANKRIIFIKDGIIVHVSKKKPFKVTVKAFKLGKRVFKQFLKLRAMFDGMKALST